MKYFIELLDQWMDQPIMGAEEHPALALISRMNTIKTECSSAQFFKRWDTANDPAEMITPPQTPPEMSIDGLKVCTGSLFLPTIFPEHSSHTLIQYL